MPVGGFCIPNSLIANPINFFIVLLSTPSCKGSGNVLVYKFNVACNTVGIEPKALYNDNTTSPPTK